MLEFTHMQNWETVYELKDCGIEGFFWSKLLIMGTRKRVTFQSLLSSSRHQSLLKSLPKITFLFPTSNLQNEYLCAESRFLLFWRPFGARHCRLQIGTKPPLGGEKIPRCATKLVVDGSMITKVIFTWHWAGPRVEIAAGLAAVDV